MSGVAAKGAEATSAIETIPVASDRHACPRREEGASGQGSGSGNKEGTGLGRVPGMGPTGLGRVPGMGPGRVPGMGPTGF